MRGIPTSLRITVMDLKESIVDNKDVMMMMMMTMTTKMMTKDDDDAFPGDDPTIQILGCSTKAPQFQVNTNMNEHCHRNM